MAADAAAIRISRLAEAGVQLSRVATSPFRRQPECSLMSRASRTLMLLATTASALVVTACPLPVARTEATSAPVIGTIMWADGTPASGLEVGVATDWGDVVCSNTEV